MRASRRRTRPSAERERDPSSSCSRCPFGSFKRNLDGTKIGDEKMSNTTTRVLMNTGTNDDVRFLSPFSKFSLLRIEANGREKRKKAWRSFVRSDDTMSLWYFKKYPFGRPTDQTENVTDFGVLFFLSKLRQARWCDLSAKTRRKQSFKTWSTK